MTATCARAVASGVPLTTLPSIFAMRSGTSRAMRSITFSSSALSEVTLALSLTADFAHSALRSCLLAMASM